MIDFDTLTLMRIAQSGGIALLFVPISTISYVTLPKELNGDAAALYTMFRNVSGSIGISLSTAEITQRTQIRTAYLVDHLNPFDQGYNRTIQSIQQNLLSTGHAAATTMATATGQVYQMLRTQASVLAYSDVFAYCAIGAFCVVPFAFLFSNVKAKGGGGGRAIDRALAPGPHRGTGGDQPLQPVKHALGERALGHQLLQRGVGPLVDDLLGAHRPDIRQNLRHVRGRGRVHVDQRDAVLDRGEDVGRHGLLVDQLLFLACRAGWQ